MRFWNQNVNFEGSKCFSGNQKPRFAGAKCSFSIRKWEIAGAKSVFPWLRLRDTHAFYLLSMITQMSHLARFRCADIIPIL